MTQAIVRSAQRSLLSGQECVMNAWWTLAVIIVTLGAGIGVNSVVGRRRTMAWAGVLALGVVGLVLVYVFGQGVLNRAPHFTSIRDKPSDARHGWIAFNSLPSGSSGGKSSCVFLIPASGREPARRLFCRPQDEARSAALTWRSDGSLVAMNRGRPHWGAVVSFPSETVTAISWQQPAPIPTFPSDGPGGRQVTFMVGDGTLSVTLRQGGVTRTLWRSAVPPAYQISSPHWSPDGEWFVAESGSGELILITTGTHPTVLLVHDRAEDAAVTGSLGP